MLHGDTSAARPLTISVPEAGKRLGVGRNQAYEAARSGQLPTIRIGKRLLVPVVALERLLRGELADPSA
jgi:excisionase family DNA binding protein